MEAKIGVAIPGRKHCNPELTSSNSVINLVEQLFPRFHVLAVEKWLQPQHGKMVVQQTGNRSLRIDSPVVYKHVANA